MLNSVRNFYREYIFTPGWYGRNVGLFCIAIFIYFADGLEGFLVSISLFTFLILCEIFADTKYIPWICGIIASIGAIYFANWFFDDIKKTLSFPLTVICYVIAKRLLPETVSDFLNRVENYIVPGRRDEKDIEVDERKNARHKYNRLIVHSGNKPRTKRGKRRR